ncbi:hypothetical protein [Thalassotalea sp. PLHSN55]|uniref:hypothetical protein n=1 Tax=Thalassotalea sp. PLHSN55 TaxID=3435888 RepID=UPI003F82B7A3
MLHKINLVIISLVVVILNGLFSPAHANSNDLDLTRQGDVTLTAWIGLEPQEAMQSYSVKEQVILTLEVATPRRFSEGTRISLVDVPNVLIKQRNQMAMNYTERVKNTTWSIQRWELVMYPLASGKITLPEFPVHAQVIDKNGKPLDVTLFTKPLSFNAHLPSGQLTEGKKWLAAKSLAVEQEWQFSSEKLKVGDAVTRTITMDASDAISVLLPELMTEKIDDNYQRYNKPVRFIDSANRGEYKAKKTEESVYILQEGGSVTLPELSISFWNTESETLETITLEGQTLAVAHTFSSLVKTYWQQAVVIFLTIAGILASIYAIKRYYKTRPLPPIIILLATLKSKKWNVARTLLYRHNRMVTGSMQLINDEQALAEQAQKVELQMGKEKTSLFLSIWFQIKKIGRSRIIS